MADPKDIRRALMIAAEPLAVPSTYAEMDPDARAAWKTDQMARQGHGSFAPPGTPEREENFGRWYSSSKVRDTEGNPLRLYHATPKSFDTFIPGGPNPVSEMPSGPATWLSPYPDKQPAGHHVGGFEDKFKSGANVMPVHADIRNPLVIDNKDMRDWARQNYAKGSGEFPLLLTPETRKLLLEDGYDGIFWAGSNATSKDEAFYDEHGIGEHPSKDEEIIALHPPGRAQIKSAIGNRGQYDPEDTHVNYALGGSATKRALMIAHEVGSPERQQAFDQWGGTPERWYHGTSKDVDFSKFKVGRHGAWFTRNPETASMYAKENDSQGYKHGPDETGRLTYLRTNTRSRVIPVHLKFGKAHTGQLPDDVMGATNYKKAQSDWFDRLRAQGYDSWVPEGGDVAVILKDPTNIKSAIGNVGTFDPKNADIGKAKGGRTKRAIRVSDPEQTARAKALGFDTDKVWYHSSLGPLDKFDAHGKFMGRSGTAGIHLTDSPEAASRYLDRYGDYDYKGRPFQKNIIPVYVKAGKVLERNEPFKSPIGLGMPVPDNYESPVKKMGYDALLRRESINKRGNIVGHVEPGGRNSVDHAELVLHDPSRVRSVFAQYDPDATEGPELSRAAGGSATKRALMIARDQRALLRRVANIYPGPGGGMDPSPGGGAYIGPGGGRYPGPSRYADGGKTKKPISDQLEKEMVQKYNEYLPTIEEQYNKSDAHHYIHTLKELVDMYGDETDIPFDALEIAKKYGSVLELKESDNAYSEYYPPHETHKLKDFMEDAVRNNGGVFPATSLRDIEYKHSFSVHDAFVHMAKAKGWNVSKGPRNIYKYFDIEKELPKDRRPTDEWGDPITHVRLGVRIADHPNTSHVGHAVYGKSDVHLNIAPQTDPYSPAHDLEDAARIMDEAHVNEEGEPTYQGRPLRKYALGGKIPPFKLYSGAAKLIAQKGQAKATPQQYAAMPGIKPDELKYAKFDTLPAKAQPREEVIKHLEANTVPLQETVYAGDDERSALSRYSSPSQSLALPGGANYREVLLKLPLHAAAQEAKKRAQELNEAWNARKAAKQEFLDTRDRQGPEEAADAHKRYEDAIKTYETAMWRHMRATAKAAEANFQSDHWPEEPNVVAHIRMHDRKGPNGEKVLHVEELQSDWGQQGREKGFKTAPLTPNERDEFNQLNVLPDKVRTPEQTQRLYELYAKSNGIPPGPYVDNTQKWTDLALKRVLHEAAHGGYDKIVVTPGDEQNKRYDLSKKVKNISYFPDIGYLHATTHDNEGIEHNDVKPADLAKHIGKEAADRILKQAPQRYEGRGKLGGEFYHELEGDDLKMGGSGMRGYYDNILPKRLQALAQQHDPKAKVQLGGHRLPPKKKLAGYETDPADVLEHMGVSPFDWSVRWPAMSDEEKAQAHAAYENSGPALHSLDVTPQMRDSIKQNGFNQFKRGGEVGDPIKDWQWRPTEDVRNELQLDEIPSHVHKFGEFMDESARRAMNEGFTPRDLIKAYTITRASIQRRAQAVENIRKSGLILPPDLKGMIRPEGAFGHWLHTKHGQRYLDEAEAGRVDEEAIADAQKVMKPFGKTEKDLPDALRWAPKNLPGQEGRISELVARAYRGHDHPDDWRDATAGLKGIGPAKQGFYGANLGYGKLPTLDARQIVAHTGRPTKEAIPYLSVKGAPVAAVNRLSDRQTAMALKHDKSMSPFYQHLVHHTTWDKAAGEQTTHEDVVHPMRTAKDGGRQGYKEGGATNILGHPVARALITALGPNWVNPMDEAAQAAGLTSDDNLAAYFAREKGKPFKKAGGRAGYAHGGGGIDQLLQNLKGSFGQLNQQVAAPQAPANYQATGQAPANYQAMTQQATGQAPGDDYRLMVEKATLGKGYEGLFPTAPTSAPTAVRAPSAADATAPYYHTDYGPSPTEMLGGDGGASSSGGGSAYRYGGHAAFRSNGVKKFNIVERALAVTRRK